MMGRGVSEQQFCYYHAAGRSLAAIEAHRRAVLKAINEVRSFVMLCGAERALGGPRISGLHFAGALPDGWIRNASAPHMAIPNTDTARGQSLAHKMAGLRIPGNAEFSEMIGADALPSTISSFAPVITVNWPSYEKAKDGWVIKCPVGHDGNHATPPDCTQLTRADYERLIVTPSFNLHAFDSDDGLSN